jgi:formiminoglutamase
MFSFQLYNTDTVNAYVRLREGETKLGQQIQVPTANTVPEALQNSNAAFVIVGMPEDIGVRANAGIGGAHTAWAAFLSSFLNIQETSLLSGSSFLLLGALELDKNSVACNADIDSLRKATQKIDNLLYPIIKTVVSAGKMPIVIGGGHNNAYPLLKGCSLAKQQAVNVVNLDAHADYRALEGRHSGNGFSYAQAEGYLKKYAMLGLHEAYNSAAMIANLNPNPDCFMLYWEDIFLRGQCNFPNAVQQTLSWVNGTTFGVELDVDAIEQVLSSAITPVGITPIQAMQYLYQAGQQAYASYLHLPEGISVRADGLENKTTGKLLSYLVQAFCKGVLEKNKR